MAQTLIDICNTALQRVGASSILSMSDNSAEARACSLAYDSNRRDELRKNDWNFAIARAILTPDFTAPAFDFLYQFTLPPDCLRVLRSPTPALDWVIEGRKILTNSGTILRIRYVADIEDVSQFDSSFYSVLSASLAIDICEKLTQSNTKKQSLIKEYEEAIRMAKRVDCIESGYQEFPVDDWWIARL